MDNRIVVADASPLIALSRINHLSLLKKVLGTVFIPQAVKNECLTDMSRTDSISIQKALDTKIMTVHPNPDSKDYHALCNIVDSGEAAAIALALKLKAGLLIDEKLGRGIATQLNIKVIGTAGVLLLAKKNKSIKKVKPLLEELQQSGYFLSQALIAEILKIAKEK